MFNLNRRTITVAALTGALAVGVPGVALAAQGSGSGTSGGGSHAHRRWASSHWPPWCWR